MMNKKEQAAFDELKKQLDMARREARAWRLTEEVKPDVPPPTKSGEYTFGWHSLEYLMDSCGRVEEAASSMGSHYSGSRINQIRSGKGYVSGIQNPLPLHSTKARALKALRHKVEQRMLAMLVRLDREIEETEKTEGE